MELYYIIFNFNIEQNVIYQKRIYYTKCMAARFKVRAKVKARPELLFINVCNIWVCDDVTTNVLINQNGYCDHRRHKWKLSNSTLFWRQYVIEPTSGVPWIFRPNADRSRHRWIVFFFEGKNSAIAADVYKWWLQMCYKPNHQLNNESKMVSNCL